MSIDVSKATIHVAGEYPVRRAVRDIVKLKEPNARTGVTHQGFVLWKGLALLVAATSRDAAAWYHLSIPPRSIRALIREEEGLQTFQIGVTLGVCSTRTVTVVAEHAMQAVIAALCELRLTTLALPFVNCSVSRQQRIPPAAARPISALAFRRLTDTGKGRIPHVSSCW